MKVNDKGSSYLAESQDDITRTDFMNVLVSIQSDVSNHLLNQQILLAIQTTELAEQVKGMLTRHSVKQFTALSSLSTIIDHDS